MKKVVWALIDSRKGSAGQIRGVVQQLDAAKFAVIEKNIEDGEGYTVTMFNLDGMHPLWQNNIQMSPKRMRITNVSDNIVQLRGYGYDSMGASFADYGVVLLIENEEIIRVQLNMYDRNISIVYLK